MILTVAELADKAAFLRAEGRNLVVTNGCFDLLHVGHVRYLQAARALGDALAIGVNGDVCVRQLKGEGRPVNNEGDRAEVLSALACVDFVAIFHELRATDFLAALRAPIYVKGGDYTPETLNAEERSLLDEIGVRIVIIPFTAGYSTSRLLGALKQRKP